MQTLCRASVAVLMFFVALTSVNSSGEETKKLYINKSQNPDNYVVLKNDFATIIKHTTDGIELEFPGVDVSFRCQGNEPSADEKCIIAVQEGVVTATPTTTTPTTPTPTTPTPTTPTEPTTPTQPTTPTEPTQPPSSTSCVSGSGIECASKIIGPGGSGAYSSTPTTLTVKTILVHQLRTGGSGGSGYFLWVPAYEEGTGSSNGALLRVWISKSPGGKGDLVSRSCARASQNTSIGYSVGGSDPCNLEPNTTYYLNMQECVAPYTDRNCAAPSALSNNRNVFKITTG